MFTFRNADARIGDPDDQIPFRAGRRRDGDRSPFGREFDCVVQNVQKNLYQLVLVGPDGRQVRPISLTSFYFFSDIRSATTVRRLSKRVVDGQSLRMQVGLAQFDAGEDQKIIDEAVETLGVFMDGSQEFQRSSPGRRPSPAEGSPRNR